MLSEVAQVAYAHDSTECWLQSESELQSQVSIFDQDLSITNSEAILGEFIWKRATVGRKS